MNVGFRRSFTKDIEKLKDARIRERISQAIHAVKTAGDLDEVSGVKKLQACANFYRIRVGEFRIGIQAIGNEIVFVRCLHRKEIYRHFP